MKQQFQPTFLYQMSRQGQVHQAAGNTSADRIRRQRRTSACAATVRNFGSSQRLVPCIDGVVADGHRAGAAGDGFSGVGQMPQRRCVKTCM